MLTEGRRAQIPLPPDEVLGIWNSVKHLDFEDCHGAFWLRDTRGGSKARVLESAKLFVQFMNHGDHAIFRETVKAAPVTGNGSSA